MVIILSNIIMKDKKVIKKDLNNDPNGGFKNLKTFAEKIKWEQVYEPIEEKGNLKIATREELINLANAMADKLLA